MRKDLVGEQDSSRRVTPCAAGGGGGGGGALSALQSDSGLELSQHAGPMKRMAKKCSLLLDVASLDFNARRLLPWSVGSPPKLLFAPFLPCKHPLEKRNNTTKKYVFVSLVVSTITLYLV